MSLIRFFLICALTLTTSAVFAQQQTTNPDGEYKTYYPDGTVESISTYKDGQLNGKITQYHKNGKLSVESFFVNGQREGTTKLYYPNGELLEESVYKDGQYNGTYKRYYSNGQLKAQRQLKNNLLDGAFKEYYPDGTLATEGKARDGRFNGIIRRYNREGQLTYKGKFKNGQNDGPYETYYTTGERQQSCTMARIKPDESRRDCTRYGKDGTPQGNYFQTLLRKDDDNTLVRTFVGKKLIKEEIIPNAAL